MLKALRLYPLLYWMIYLNERRIHPYRSILPDCCKTYKYESEKQIEKKIFPVCVPVDDDRACYFRMRWKRYEKS